MVNGEEGQPWKQGPLTWGCSISSWFSQSKRLARARLAAPPPSCPQAVAQSGVLSKVRLAVAVT